MLFYFTGTGNSLYVAQRIAAQENDRLVSIVHAVKRGEFRFPAEETIGFVFPTYYYGLPSTVAEFLERLEISGCEGRYLYSVVTCGGTTGATGAMFAEAMERRGLQVDASFAVRMVDNYVPALSLPSSAGVAEVLAIADEDIAVLLGRIARRERGSFDEWTGSFAKLRTRLMYPKYQRVRRTSNFFVSDACVGCGTCMRFCNSEAIEMRERRPVWVKKSCNLCLACLHRCPKGAIEFGRTTIHHGRYIHPLADWESVRER